MIDTLTLILHGDLPLDLFAKAIRSIDALLDAIAVEVTGDDAIRWNVDRLENGSAVVRVRGVTEDFAALEATIRAYDAVGEALQRKEPIPFSPTVQRSAYALTGLLNGHITALSFASAVATRVVQTSSSEEEAERTAAQWLVSWGTLRGEVGAIASRPRLQFTLYDSLFDKAVACYLSGADEGLIRNIWRKRVEVTGRIFRRVDDDRPVRVRNVVNVEVIDAPTGDFRRARGAIPWQQGDDLPEVLIGRFRDAS